jgi:uncharacterized protein YbbC (DUF1343 family)
MLRYRSQLGLFAVAAATFVITSTASQPVTAPPPRTALGAASVVLTGIDVYELMNSEPFAGKRVGLVTNQTGVDSEGRRTIDDFAHGKDVKLVALFSPEHGISGKADAAIENATDAKTGLPIYSLYGETRRPTDEMLKGVDVLLFDVQDAGVRFYTYITTMAYCMEAAAKNHVRFVVFDRPNPLGGDLIEGPMLDPARKSFTGYFAMPVRYGMTLGELAKMFNAEDKIGADLHVFSMMNWHRGQTYDQTRLTWIPPSPNLRTVDAAFLYPGVEILQAGGVSVGRGTDAPFEIIGAPWIRADEFAAALESRKIPGVRFRAAQFTPTDGLYNGQLCQGISIAISNRAELQSMRMGLEIADALHRMYPDRFQLDKIVELLGSQSTVDRLKRGDGPADIVAGWSADLDKFRATREKYLLYH